MGRKMRLFDAILALRSPYATFLLRCSPIPNFVRIDGPLADYGARRVRLECLYLASRTAAQKRKLSSKTNSATNFHQFTSRDPLNRFSVPLLPKPQSLAKTAR